MLPRDFFWRVIPTVILQAPQRFAVLRGVLACSAQVVGAETQRFTVRFGDLNTPVVEGFDRRADVKLWFLDDAFAAFAASLELPRDRRLIVQGDPAVIEALGALLAAPQSALSVRFAR